MAWLLLLALLVTADDVEQGGPLDQQDRLDKDLHVLRGSVSDKSEILPVPSTYRVILVLRSHLNQITPTAGSSLYGLAPEPLFQAGANPTAASSASAMIRQLLTSQSEIRWWFATVVLALMLSDLRKDILSQGVDGRSVLAQVFKRTLTLPAAVYVPLYEILLSGMRPYTDDAISVFYHEVVLADGRVRNPDLTALMDRISVWNLLLRYSRAVPVKALALRQSGVLAPGAWAWVFYDVLVRLFPERKRRRKDDESIKDIWDCLICELVTEKNCLPYEHSLMIQFALRAPLSPKQLVDALDQRRFPFDDVSYQPLKEATGTVAGFVNERLKSGMITREDIVFGLRGPRLSRLVQGLVARVRAHLLSSPESAANLPADLVELHGELHYAILRCPDGIVPYLGLHPIDITWITNFISHWLNDADRLQSLIEAMRSGSAHSWRLFVHLLQLHALRDPAHTPYLLKALEQIELLNDPTETVVQTVQHLRSSSMGLLELDRFLSSSSSSSWFDWGRIFNALISSPFITLRLSERPVDPQLARLLSVSYQHLNPQQRREIWFWPDLQAALSAPCPPGAPMDSSTPTAVMLDGLPDADDTQDPVNQMDIDRARKRKSRSGRDRCGRRHCQRPSLHMIL